MGNAVATKNAGRDVATSEQAAKGTSLLAKFASRFAIEPTKLLETLKATCFKGAASNEQMISLLIVADQYHLNPFTKEIYAFPDKGGGIIPVIGIDGWLRIVNSHPQFESMSLEYCDDGTDDVWTQCTIHRKDRPGGPTIIREYLTECIRDTAPWKSHPRRMLRHKAIVQCARVAFGFVGIYDEDEGERIVSIVGAGESGKKPKTQAPQARVAQDPPVEHISAEQATAITEKLKEEGVAVSLFLARFEIGSIEELPAFSYESALACIDNLSAPEQVG